MKSLIKGKLNTFFMVGKQGINRHKLVKTAK